MYVTGRMERTRYALLLEYDGTDFAGSQHQDARRTVQASLEQAVRDFAGDCLGRAAFAGRTDAGVHARGQVAAVDIARRYPADTLRRALNHFLPEDVAVRAATITSPTFDPRRHAEARSYRYAIEDGRGRSPLDRRTAWQVADALDDASMARAAGMLPRETTDWAAFAGAVQDGYPTVRTLQRCEVRRTGPHSLQVTMEADGFLPHQVRRTVGALERVGRGRLDVGEFAALVAGPPANAGPVAPPHGLTLEHVQYAPQALRWDEEIAA
jgi:tRNA pseudouridine38-40 synthase